MTPSDAAIDALLEAIDARARASAYPPAGLRIWGDVSDREGYRQLVRDWLSAHQPEAQR